MKRSELSIEQINAIYKISMSVYSKDMQLKEAGQIISSKFGININSFNIYYRAVIAMLEGNVHKSSISPEVREVFLNNIFDEYGLDCLITALDSYKSSIEYYESSHNNVVRKVEWVLYNKFKDFIEASNKKSKLENNVEYYGDIYEGEFAELQIKKHKRSQEAREQCIQQKGCKCVVCGFDFEETYGNIGKGFIHVHHIWPLSTREGEYEVNVKEDLVPVCPNCHAMIHHVKDRVLSIEELKQIIKENSHDKK